MSCKDCDTNFGASSMSGSLAMYDFGNLGGDEKKRQISINIRYYRRKKCINCEAEFEVQRSARELIFQNRGLSLTLREPLFLNLFRNPNLWNEKQEITTMKICAGNTLQHYV